MHATHVKTGLSVAEEGAMDSVLVSAPLYDATFPVLDHEQSTGQFGRFCLVCLVNFDLVLADV